MYLTELQFDAMMPDGRYLLSNEPEMESSLHYHQLLILVTCLEWIWQGREDFFIGANLTIYFSRQQLRNRDFRGPDFFLVKNVNPDPRNSWVIWEENGRYPSLIIELLSNSTAEVDRGLKRELYSERFHTQEYFWFSPETQEFMGLTLSGNQYLEIEADERGWRWSDELGLFLGVEEGQLRYFESNGSKVRTPAEAALAEQKKLLEAQREVQQVQREVQQAQMEAQQAQREVQQAQMEAQQAQREVQQTRAELQQALDLAETSQAQVEHERIQLAQAQAQAQQEKEKVRQLAERLRALGEDPEAL